VQASIRFDQMRANASAVGHTSEQELHDGASRGHTRAFADENAPRKSHTCGSSWILEADDGAQAKNKIREDARECERVQRSVSMTLACRVLLCIASLAVAPQWQAMRRLLRSSLFLQLKRSPLSKCRLQRQSSTIKHQGAIKACSSWVMHPTVGTTPNRALVKAANFNSDLAN